VAVPIAVPSVVALMSDWTEHTSCSCGSACGPRQSAQARGDIREVDAISWGAHLDLVALDRMLVAPKRRLLPVQGRRLRATAPFSVRAPHLASHPTRTPRARAPSRAP
jgi:hypothetical protein